MGPVEAVIIVIILLPIVIVTVAAGRWLVLNRPRRRKR